MAAANDRVIDAIHAASDALYVRARRGAYSVLLRVPHDSKTKPEEVALPFKGLIGEAFTDPRQPGVVIRLESFVALPHHLRLRTGEEKALPTSSSV